MSNRDGLGDADGRRLIREALDDTLVVEAAAGTGKTTELVNRILRVIGEGRAHIREIVAVTFTEKAAGELKLRIRQGLDEERSRAVDPVARRRFQDAVAHLETAHVSTIHGFCADLLRERPVEAGVDPLFRVLTEGQADRMFQAAFDEWLQHQLEDPPEGLRRALRRPARRGSRAGRGDGGGTVGRLRQAARELAEWRDLRAPWSGAPFDRRALAVHVVDLVHALADLSAAPSYARDNLFIDTEPVRRLSRQLRELGAEALADLDGVEARLIELAGDWDFRRARKGGGPAYGAAVSRTQVVEARNRLMAALEEFRDLADADLAARLQGELLACVDAYEQRKRREGVLDFLDLLIRARDLVRDNREVRQHFQGRFTRIFVDEFQDTDPLQAELLLLLAAQDPGVTRWRDVDPVPGRLFIVGDPKQSIYRFRRADVGTYQDVCRHLVARGAVRVELRRSFRSVPNIQRAVNAAFAPLMTKARAPQAEYMPLEPYRPDLPGQPSLVALPVPAPYAQRRVGARAIESSLPDAVAAFIEWLVSDSGWRVTDRRSGGERVPVEARHVTLLFRRFVSFQQDVTRPYADALEARGIRHLLVGGRAFHDREEIETLRCALAAVEWPDDELSVFATLRGALFAIGDEELLEYRHLVSRGLPGGRARFHPFRVPPSLPAGLQPIGDALTLLARLHRRRNLVPVADTVGALLAHTRAHVGFALRNGGEQALANVLHVAELARQYEIEGGLSFRGFVDALRDAAATGESAEAPILEEAADGVRLMTVHKAKGLEFPVVILADITARLAPYDAARFIDASRGLCALRVGGMAPRDLLDHREEELRREREEGERVAYVAATRARDLLVVPGVGDGPYPDGWVSPLSPAIYPSEDRRRIQTPAIGCPPFPSRDSVQVRPDGDPASQATVCPGQHVVGAGDAPHTVVWWAPQALRLDVDAPIGFHRDDLIVKDVDPATLRQYQMQYESWVAGRQAAIRSGSRPSLAVRLATEVAADPEAPSFGDIEVSMEDAGRSGRKVGGPRFGTLVHTLISDVDLQRHEAVGVRRLAERHGRVLGADEAEIEEAVDTVLAVLAHPLLQAAAAAAGTGRCHREVPVTLRAGGGLIEGQVDLAFDDGNRFVVVDFKTDREIEDSRERYERQVRLYAAAVRAATGRPVRAALMRV